MGEIAEGIAQGIAPFLEAENAAITQKVRHISKGHLTAHIRRQWGR